MKLTEIQEEWKKDSELDRTELGEEALRIPKLHSKYWNIYCAERAAARALQEEYNILYRDKYQYYNGTIDEDTLRERQWAPNPLKILRADSSIFLDADKELQAAKNKAEFATDKLKFIEDVIKSLSPRGYNIRAAIDWQKFMSGQ